MMMCPNWERLLAHRFDPELDEPEDFREALGHLDHCDDCRIAAYEADPSLIFLGMPAVEVSAAEVRRVAEAVTTLRQGLELLERPAAAAAKPAFKLDGWRVAAMVALAAVLGTAGGRWLERGVPAPLPAAPATVPVMTAAAGTAEAAAEELVQATFAGVNWREAPVIETVSSPEARVYTYPARPDAKLALVMVIDPNLDV